MFQRPSFWKAGVVAANVAIVAYLYWHVSTHRKTPHR
ncbi:MAG: hypothetical protein ACLP6Z_10490 [Steroidobacteraceae bacterium]